MTRRWYEALVGLAAVCCAATETSGFVLPGACVHATGAKGSSKTPRGRASHNVLHSTQHSQGNELLSRRDALARACKQALAVAVGVMAPFGSAIPGASARPEGVNKPELLPKEQTNVIDLERMLTRGEVKRMDKQLSALEKDTGFRLRVLCQSYPNTPGLAIKDYWALDDKTIVLVADRRTGAGGAANLLNFNVAEGDGLRLALPNQFWGRLQNKYGNRYFVRDNGEDVAVINAVESIIYCLRKGFCVDVPSLDRVTGSK